MLIAPFPSDRKGGRFGHFRFPVAVGPRGPRLWEAEVTAADDSKQSKEKFCQAMCLPCVHHFCATRGGRPKPAHPGFPFFRRSLPPWLPTQELERMIEEAKNANSAGAATAAAPVSEPMVDEAIAAVEAGMRQEITVTIDEQAAVQRMRAEASVIGERLGLGNMQVGRRHGVGGVAYRKGSVRSVTLLFCSLRLL